MTLLVNGEARDTNAATILEFLQEMNLHERMVVVEQNGEIAPRENYKIARLQNNDTLEIVQMMAGG